MEDAAFPPLAAWFIEAFRVGFSRIPRILHRFFDFLNRLITGKSIGRMGGVLRGIIGETASEGTVVFLSMGVDRSDGTMSLGSDNLLQMAWPYKNSIKLYNAIIAAGAEFRFGWSGGVVMLTPLTGRSWWVSG